MQEKYRFSWSAFVLFLIIAAFFDLTTLIPFVGILSAPIFWVLFAAYLYKTGHGLISLRNLIPGSLSFVAEVIPLVQALPTFIISTVIIFILSRLEDKTGVHMMPHKGPKSKHLQKNQPLNQNGVRMPRKVQADEDEELDMAA